MDLLGRRKIVSLLGAAALASIVAAASPALAQESFDPAQLDTSGMKAKAKAKKSAGTKPAAQAPAKSGKPGGDRQFGELEGWSPGKAPPGAAAGKDDGPSNGLGKAPVSMSPSGQPAIGLTF